MGNLPEVKSILSYLIANILVIVDIIIQNVHHLTWGLFVRVSSSFSSFAFLWKQVLLCTKSKKKQTLLN